MIVRNIYIKHSTYL